MKLAVPCRFEFDLLDRLNKINTKYESIHEVFGTIPASIIGHGRATAGIEYFGKIDMDHVKKFTEKAHSVGIEVNYLLNAQCLGNTEFTEEGRTEIMKYLESVYAANVDSVTVAIPLLADIIKREFPDLKVVVSVISEANNPHRVALWKKMGVDRVNIDYDSNRDFKRLKSISRNANIDLELLVNDGCLFFCPFQKYHRVLSAHGSKTGIAKKNYIDYCLLKCSIERTDNLAEIIRGPWIRPEDTEFYEKEFGIRFFKISGRYQPADWIVNVAEAYSRKSYEGNFMDLLSLTYPTLAAHRIIVPVLKDGQVVTTPPKVHIDNKKLAGFFNHIVKIGGCGDDSQCELCRHCEKTAQEVVEVKEPKEMKDYNRFLKLTLDTLLKSPIEVNASGHRLKASIHTEDGCRT